MRSTELSGQNIVSLQEKIVKYGFQSSLAREQACVKVSSYQSPFKSMLYQGHLNIDQQPDHFLRLLFGAVGPGRESLSAPAISGGHNRRYRRSLEPNTPLQALQSPHEATLLELLRTFHNIRCNLGTTNFERDFSLLVSAAEDSLLMTEFPSKNSSRSELILISKGKHVQSEHLSKEAPHVTLEDLFRFGLDGFLSIQQSKSNGKVVVSDADTEQQLEDIHREAEGLIEASYTDFIGSSRIASLKRMPSEIKRRLQLATYHDVVINNPRIGTVGAFYDQLKYRHSTGEKHVREGQRLQQFYTIGFLRTESTADIDGHHDPLEHFTYISQLTEILAIDKEEAMHWALSNPAIIDIKGGDKVSVSLADLSIQRIRRVCEFLNRIGTPDEVADGSWLDGLTAKKKASNGSKKDSQDSEGSKFGFDAIEKTVKNHADKIFDQLKVYEKRAKSEPDSDQAEQTLQFIIDACMHLLNTALYQQEQRSGERFPMELAMARNFFTQMPFQKLCTRCMKPISATPT